MSSVTGAIGRVEEKDITAQNIFSDALVIKKGVFNLSLSGTWVATVHVQRSFDTATPDWKDVDSFTVNVERIALEPERALYRFGVKTGNYTSGTVVGRLGQ